MRRRTVLHLLAAGLCVAATMPAVGNDYPSRPIRIVVGQEPGAQSDSTARVVAKRLAEILGQPVVVQNRGGAGGTIGAEAVARSPADGYTILLGGPGNLALAAAIDPNLRYNPVRDFAPLGRIVRIPWAFAVNSQLPVATVPELVGYARAHPGKLTYASAGVTSVQNLAVEMMKTSYGIDMVHVPYKGSGPALTDVIAGRVNFIIADLSVLKPHARSGEVRLLATTGPHRTRAAPELPTVIEQGLSGYVVESWNALVVPSGTPPDVVANLQRALRQTLNTREVIEELERLGFEPLDEDAQVLARLLPIEVERFSQTVKRLAIHAGQ